VKLRPACAALAFVACAESSPPPAVPPPAPDPPPPPTVTPPAAGNTPTAAPAPPAIDRWAGTHFPPADFAPMHERTAKPGDGVYAPMPHGLGDAPVMARALVHPHPIKGFVFVDVVAFDRSRVGLHLVAGTEEPESGAAIERPGLVPPGDRERLLAAFNGGFMARHGRYGMMIDGVVLVPPIDDACGVAFFDDGRLAIASWPTLAQERARAFRQTPPCLVEKGEVNPALAAEMASRKWGAAAGGDREIRRSAIGLDASGRTLFYGFGDWITASMLAEAMKRVGAHDVAELDINWSYTRFFVFDHPPGELPVIASTIVPKLEYSPRAYVEKPSSRDFFYLTLDR
jgi:hypothetical protein